MTSNDDTDFEQTIHKIKIYQFLHYLDRSGINTKYSEEIESVMETEDPLLTLKAKCLEHNQSKAPEYDCPLCQRTHPDPEWCARCLTYHRYLDEECQLKDANLEIKRYELLVRLKQKGIDVDKYEDEIDTVLYSENPMKELESACLEYNQPEYNLPGVPKYNCPLHQEIHPHPDHCPRCWTYHKHLEEECPTDITFCTKCQSAHNPLNCVKQIESKFQEL